MDKNRNNKNSNKPFNLQRFLIYLIITTGLTLLLNIFFTSIVKDSLTKEISYTEFLKMADNHQFEKVIIQKDKSRIVAIPNNDSKSALQTMYYTGLVDDQELVSTLLKDNIEISGEIPQQVSPVLYFVESWVLPLLATGLLMSYIGKKTTGKIGGGFGGLGMGKSDAKIYVDNGVGVTFDDVAGQDEAKESLMEIVDYLNHPDKYTDIGARLPKGALLVGPPGTGKTLLAKAVAGEAKVPFFSISGSDFVEMFVGMGASRVRDLFKQAAEKAPCIVFIDEIDAIGKSRDSISTNDEREQTLNQLLAEMDGFDKTKAVVILGATNRPEILDKALLRPGRFDRMIYVTEPDKEGREQILKVHTRNVKLDPSVNLEAIALATAGASGADLANLVNEAALRAVRMNRKEITQEDLMESFETVAAGAQRKNHILNEKERKIVSYHEIGHALVSAKLKHTMPVSKITIIPRTSGALGFTMQLPEEEQYLKSKSELLDEITTLLGGRAAEKVEFNEISTGASNDIEKATDLARKIVTIYGMSDEFGTMGLETVSNQYLDGKPVRNCADATSAEVDEVIRKTMNSCYQKALQILTENKSALDSAAGFLIEKETITGKEFLECIGDPQLSAPESENKA